MRKFKDYCAPPSKEVIIKTLAGMAALFSAPPVDQLVIDLYIAALSRLPRTVFLEAREKLLLSHKWPRLPTPADFVEAGAAEQSRINAVNTVLTTRLYAYKRALEKLHACSNSA